MGQDFVWVRRLAVAGLIILACGTASAEGVHRIALVSDPHVSGKLQDEAYLRHFSAVIEEVNAAGVEAVLIAGDLTQGGAVEDMGRFKEMVKGFHAKVWFVAGNHDVGNKVQAGQKTSLSEKRLKTFAEQVGPLYFSEEVVPGVRVVGICSSLMGGGLEEEKGQWEFLEKSLPAKGGEAVVVLTHYPPFVSKIDEADAYWNMNKAPRERLMGMIDGAGVKTVLSGHLHRPIEYTAGGVHVIGAPAVSFGLPRGKQPEGWVLVTVGEGGKCEGELKYLPMDAATKPAGK